MQIAAFAGLAILPATRGGLVERLAVYGEGDVDVVARRVAVGADLLVRFAYDRYLKEHREALVELE